MKREIRIPKEESGRIKIVLPCNSVARRGLARNTKYRRKPIRSPLDSLPEADMGGEA